MNDVFESKCREFYKLCDKFDITYPDVEQSTHESDFTSIDKVSFGSDTDIPHLFGHFLCDYHTVEPDLVADGIKELLTNG